MNQNYKSPQKIIEDFCQKLLEALHLSGDTLISEEESVWWVKFEVEDPGLLIGRNGENILLLEHIVRRITNKHSKEESPMRIMVDVNRYRKHRMEALRELAKQAADEARFSQRVVEFEPMPAYERRIVHVALAERPDVITESVGEGFERHVTVRSAS